MRKLTSVKTISSRIGKFKISFQNQLEFHTLKREIFGQESYYFESDTLGPKILDVGAHIGLSCLYFKKLYPQAQVTCLEPIPSSFKLLETNVFENNLSDVTCLQKAFANTSQFITLYIDPEKNGWYSTTSIKQGAWDHKQNTQPIQVPAITLNQLITQPIDLLKLDIEGAEQMILEHNQSVLPLVKQLLIEFHPMANQSLSSLTDLLEKSNYKLEFRKNGQSVTRQNAKGLIIIYARK